MEYMIVFKEPQSDIDRRHDDAYWGAWGAYVAALQQSGSSKGGDDDRGRRSPVGAGAAHAEPSPARWTTRRRRNSRSAAEKYSTTAP